LHLIKIENLLAASPGNRRNQHHFIAVLKRIRAASEKPNILVVHVNVDKSPQLARFILDLGRERGKVLVDILNQRGQICRIGG